MWFVPKSYGYGATPITWQGWAVTAGYVLVVVAGSIAILNGGRFSPTTWIAWGAFVAASVFAFAVFTKHKTDGEWKWRWGAAPDKSNG